MKYRFNLNIYLLLFTLIISQVGYTQHSIVAPTVLGKTPISKIISNHTSSKPLGIKANSTAICLAEEATNSFVQQQMALYPNYQSKIDQQNITLKNWAQNYIQNKNGMVVRTIPVVVHVIHNPSNSNSPDENVADSYIYDMLTTLNEDFRRLNSDASQTRSIFTSVAADSEIEFCLASKDPNGVTTTGITRTSTSEGYFHPDTETNKMKSDATGGKTGWPSTDYLNIWICNISNYANSGTAGYAYLPTPGMHGSSIDGLVIDFKLGIYYGGRTTTHEIGHYLGLQHTWGSNPPSCNNDDGFADTPNSSSENYGCNYNSNTCSGGNVDQIENYMSYANCQNMYSTDQAAYMNSVLSNTRSSLLSSTGCEPTSSPSADFTADKTTVQAGGYVSFSDLTTGVPTTWSWNFGGGGTPNTSTDKDPTIQFNTIGTYTVSLTVTNTLGSDTETKTAYINVTAPSGCDTINWSVLTTNPLYYYIMDWVAPYDSGTITGTNTYGDLSKAQLITTGEYAPNTHVTGGYFYFGKAHKAIGSSAQVIFRVWDNTGTAGAPGNVLGADTMDLADIVSNVQGNYYTWMLFDSPVQVTSDYYFGFSMHNFDAYGGPTADTLAMVQTQNGTGGPSMPWEEWSDNTWADYGQAYGFTQTTIFAAPFMTDQPPTASFTASPTSGCSGLTVNFDGSASTNVIDYYWDFDGDGYYDDVDTVDGLISHTYDTSGTFNVTLLTVGSCDGLSKATQTSLITINPKPILTTSATNTSCGSCNGTATVTASGASAPYTYLWNDPSNSVTNSIASLCDASYQVTVTDGNGCIEIAGVNVLDGASMSISTSATNATCGNTNGTATANATGGTSPYTYIWNDPGNQATQTATGLGAGTYNVTVTDASGCTIQTDFFSAAVITSSGGTISITTSATNATCGNSDGTATVAISSGGTAPFTYSWSNGASGATATGLPAGSYTVIVTDGSGCTATGTATVSDAGGPSTTTSSTDATCNGGSDGTATVSVTGGTTPYTYSWSNGGSTPSISGLAAATYSVNVTDASGCVASESVTVGEPAAIGISISSTDENCGNSDGTATAQPSGGNTPYTYSWSNGQTTSTATGLSASTYQVVVTDASGCSSSGSITINSSTGPTVTTSSTDASCGNTDGTATANVSGGTAPYTYAWSDGQTGSTATGLSAGNYTVDVTDANGCIATQTASISDAGAPTITSTSSDVTCFGDTDGSASVTASGGSAPYTYSWDDTNNSTSSSISGLATGTYNATITDASGCQATASETISEPAVLGVTTTTTTTVQGGPCTGTITATPSGGTPTYNYLWSDGQTTQTASNLCVGSYTVTVTDANGCSTTGTQLVSEVTSIDEASTFNINIYPNPTNGSVQFEFPNPESKDGHIEIINLRGELISKVQLSNDKHQTGTIDLSDHPSGIYFIHGILGNDSFITKLSVIK